MTTAMRRVAGVTASAVAVMVLGAGPAVADPAPVLECVAANPDGSYTAVLGVDNDGPSVTIPVGKDTNGKLDNRFSGGDDRGQPTLFPSGRSVGSFTLDVLDGKAVTWHLGSSKLKFDRDGTPCSDAPVAPDVPTVVLGAVAAAAGAAWAFRRVDGRTAAT